MKAYFHKVGSAWYIKIKEPDRAVNMEGEIITVERRDGSYKSIVLGPYVETNKYDEDIYAIEEVLENEDS